VRFPVKLNRSGWPATIGELLHGKFDPRCILESDVTPQEFSASMSSLKFGATYKSTKDARFPLTLSKIADLEFSHPPKVLDVGASDGSASLEIIQSIDFSHYFVTDSNVFVHTAEDGKWTYFFTPDGSPILAASDRWVVYNDATNAFPPQGFISRKTFKSASLLFDNSTRKIELINPGIREIIGRDVSFKPYNAMEQWEGGKVDLIIVANLLNRTYFGDDQMREILNNLSAALEDEGWIVLIDNRGTERSSILRVEPQGVTVTDQVGGGASSEALALSVLNEGMKQ
jgi:hypothetical protein